MEKCQKHKKEQWAGSGSGMFGMLFVDVGGVVGKRGRGRMLKGEKGGKEEGRKRNRIQEKSRSGWCMACIRIMPAWEKEEEEEEGGPSLSFFRV